MGWLPPKSINGMWEDDDEFEAQQIEIDFKAKSMRNMSRSHSKRGNAIVFFDLKEKQSAASYRDRPVDLKALLDHIWMRINRLWFEHDDFNDRIGGTEPESIEPNQQQQKRRLGRRRRAANPEKGPMLSLKKKREKDKKPKW